MCSYFGRVVPQSVGGGGRFEVAYHGVIVECSGFNSTIIVGDGQNIPWYSPGENNTLAFVPLAYSEVAQWVAGSAGTNFCGVRYWKDWDVIVCCPKLMTVKKIRELIRLSSSIQVNHAFWSSTTMEVNASWYRSSQTWIWSSVLERISNWYQCITVRRTPSANCPWMVLIFRFNYV